MTHTVDEIALSLGVDADAARGLIKFLLNVKPPLASFRGERRLSSVGHGPRVYEIHPDAHAVVLDLISRLA